MSKDIEETLTNFHKKWGEFDDTSDQDDINSVNIPIEDLNKLIQDAMQPDALKNLMSKDETNPEKFEIKVGCSRILNTIDLQLYYNNILDMTDDMRQKLGKLTTADLDQVPPIPDPPQEVDQKYKPNCLNFIHPFESDFINGISEPVPDIDRRTSRILLRRCILLILAQIGYTDVYENTLDTFIGAVDEYYKRLTKIIHSKMESALKGFDTQFCDIYEHSLQDVGVGGIRGLQRYYQLFVLEYETRVYKKCVKARQDLITLIETPHKTSASRRRRKQSLDETLDCDFVHNYETYPSTSGLIRAEIPVLHLPEDGSSYVDANLYELIPDVEITDGEVDEAGSENRKTTSRGGLMSIELASDRSHAEDSTTGYFDVEDLDNF